MSKEQSAEERIFYKVKPKLTVDVSSPDGNIFFILTKAAKLLEKSYPIRQTERIAEMRVRATAKDNDYNKALDVIREYVDLEITE